MLVYTVRSSTVKLLGIILIAALCAAVVLFGGGEKTVYASSGGVTVYYDGIKDEQGRIDFIEGFGLKVIAEGRTEESFRMPKDFDRIIGGYNQIQRRQGLDLERYKNRRVTHYSYKVDIEGKELEVNLYQLRDKIIACDLTDRESRQVYPLTELPEGVVSK